MRLDFLRSGPGDFGYWFLFLLEPMKASGRRRKCLHCKAPFLPDYRNAPRQRYCREPECRRVRKAASQRAWLAKPENQSYFRDVRNAQRVRDWQKDHLGYWKNTARYQRRTLQDGCPSQVITSEQVAPGLTPPPATSAPVIPAPFLAPDSPHRTLRDLCSRPLPLFAGIISMFIGSTLPDDIAVSARRLLTKGYDILGMVPGVDVNNRLYEKTCPQPGTTPEGPTPVQLDRSPAGAGELLRAL